MGPRKTLAIGLSLFLWLAGIGAADDRLGEDVLPQRQRLRLDLDPRREDYHGITAIELWVQHPTQVLRLLARDLEIGSASLQEGPKGRSRPLQAASVGKDILAFGDGAVIEAGDYVLEIHFRQRFNRQSSSLYRSEIRGAPYLFTQFQATEARGAFPCFDEPSFKIPYELELRIPAGFDAVTNTPMVAEREEQGERVLVFGATPKLPSYLVAVAVGTFDYVEIPGLSIPGRVVMPRGINSSAELAVAWTPRLLAAFETYFAMPYPFAKLDLVAVPEFLPGAMENPGAISFSAEILLPGAKPSAADRLRLAKTLAHELAHLWFGDTVTMAWWDDLWLNESFADWLGDKIADQVFPELGIAASQLGTVATTLAADGRPSATAVREPGIGPELAMQTVGTAYFKGKAILTMVEAWIGPEPFRRGLQEYIRRFAWRSATSQDLWRTLATVSELPVEAVMRSFLEQPGLPLVEVEPLEGQRIRLTQRRYLGDQTSLPDLQWQIPLRLRIGGGGRQIEQSFLLTERRDELSLEGLDRVEWILPNGGPTGYYRWVLPPKVFAATVSAGSQVLTPAERRHLLASAEGLLQADLLPADTYLDLLSRSAQDPDPTVSSGSVQALQGARVALAAEGTARGWPEFLRASLGPWLERIGREPLPGESPAISALRPTLLTWLGREGHDPAILEWGKNATRELLAGQSRLDRGLAAAALQLGALQGDHALFRAYLERALAAEAAPDQRALYLGALGFFRDPAALAEAQTLYPNGKIRADETFFLFGQISVDPGFADTLLAWAIQHHARFAADLPPEYLALFVGLGGGCSRERFERAAAFYGAPERKVGATERQIQQVGDQVRACLALRARHAPTAQRFLAGFAR